jgi:hypothetical protein
MLIQCLWCPITYAWSAIAALVISRATLRKKEAPNRLRGFLVLRHLWDSGRKLPVAPDIIFCTQPVFQFVSVFSATKLKEFICSLADLPFEILRLSGHTFRRLCSNFIHSGTVSFLAPSSSPLRLGYAAFPRAILCVVDVSTVKVLTVGVVSRTLLSSSLILGNCSWW